MKFSKQQIQVLILLNIVAVVMLIGVLIMPKMSGGGGAKVPVQGEIQNPQEPDKPKVHDKFRDPRITFDEDIFWETNIGGSGSETVENAYEISSKLFIFGNTDSDDLDFDGAKGGAYISVLSENGKPLAYFFYDGELIKSALHESGFFCLMKNGDDYEVLVIDLNGTVKTQKKLPLTDGETAQDFIIDYETGTVNIVIAVDTERLPNKRVQLLALSRDLEPLEGLVLPSAYPLEYVAILPRENGYLIAVNADGGKYDELILYEWNVSSDSLYTAYECRVENKSYAAASFIPYLDGYAALIIDEFGVADILVVDYELNNPKIILLNESGACGGNIYCDNKSNYVFLSMGDGSSKAYKMPLDLSGKTELISFATQTEIDAFKFTKTDTFFGGRNAYSPVVSAIDGSGILQEKSFGSTTDKIKVLIPSNGFIFVICQSSGVSQTIGKNFGGSDIVVLKLRY